MKFGGIVGATDNFRTKLQELDALQEEIDINILNEDELLADIDEAAGFREDKVKQLYLVEGLLRRIEQREQEARQREGHVDAGSNVGTVASTSSQLKLPKLVLPKFSGDPTTWNAFWDMISAHIHNNEELSSITKFSYLVGCLEREAANTVKGLSLSDANYDTALEILKTRFGRKELIIHDHIKALLHLQHLKLEPHKSSEYVSELWKFRDDVLGHVKVEVILTPIILTRLPVELQREWARGGEGHEGDLKWLLRFLEHEIGRLERAEKYQEDSPKMEDRPAKKHKESYPSAAALYVSEVSGATAVGGGTDAEEEYSTSQRIMVCDFCSQGNHKSENCNDILRVQFNDRREYIKGLGNCKSHIAIGCRQHCSYCRGKHHVILCRRKYAPTKDFTVPDKVPLSSPESTANLESGVKHKGTVLGTAKIDVLGEDGSICRANVLFDNCAGRSYLSQKFVSKCKPKWVTKARVPYSGFAGQHSARDRESDIYRVKLLDNEGVAIPVITAEIPMICVPFHRPVIPKKIISQFGDIDFANDYSSLEEVDVDILFGLDFFHEIIDATKCDKVDKVVSYPSPFGCILFGSWVTTNHDTSSLPQNEGLPQMLLFSDVSDRD